MVKIDRRKFIKKGLIGGALLAVGGGTGLALRRTRLAFTPHEPLKFLTEEEFAICAAFAERIIPGGANHPPASELRVAEKCDAVMARSDSVTKKEFKQLLGLFDNALAAFFFDFRFTPFTQLDPEDQDRAIDQWRRSRITLRRTGYQALKRLACACYYGSPEAYAGTGYKIPYDPKKPEKAAAEEATTPAAEEALQGATP